jgi:cytochrome c-type biogenesis protein CcmH/NrfF
MTKELLLQKQVDVDSLQNEGDEKEQAPFKDIDKEIECPRCHDIMILSSDFDKLGYLCHDCNLSLFIN